MLESQGIPTVNLSINLKISEKLRAPRTVFVKFPHGASFGEPGNLNQQRMILRDLFKALFGLEEPGRIIEPGYRWKRTSYDPVGPESFPA